MTAPLHRDITSGRPHQWQKRETVILADWLNVEFRALSDDLSGLWDRVAQWTDAKMPSSSGGERVGGGKYADDGSQNGSTPRYVLRYIEKSDPDPIARQMRTMLEGMAQIAIQMERVRAAQRELAIADGEALGSITTRVGAGTCANPHCQREVPGGKDRLRSGRCNACDVHRRKHGEERPAAVCWPAMNEADVSSVSSVP